MAFLLNKTTLSALRIRSQKGGDALTLSRRGFHVKPGAREKALLADDPSLRPFKSYKKALLRLKCFGHAGIVVIVAGCCYEIYVKATMREEARKQAKVGM